MTSLHTLQLTHWHAESLQPCPIEDQVHLVPGGAHADNAVDRLRSRRDYAVTNVERFLLARRHGSRVTGAAARVWLVAQLCEKQILIYFLSKSLLSRSAFATTSRRTFRLCSSLVLSLLPLVSSSTISAISFFASSITVCILFASNAGTTGRAGVSEFSMPVSLSLLHSDGAAL